MIHVKLYSQFSQKVRTLFGVHRLTSAHEAACRFFIKHFKIQMLCSFVSLLRDLSVLGWLQNCCLIISCTQGNKLITWTSVCQLSQVNRSINCIKLFFWIEKDFWTYHILELNALRLENCTEFEYFQSAFTVQRHGICEQCDILSNMITSIYYSWI